MERLLTLMVVIINNQTLRINNVQPGDEGLYTCSNAEGNVLPISCVVVSGKQYIEIQLNSVVQ